MLHRGRHLAAIRDATGGLWQAQPDSNRIRSHRRDQCSQGRSEPDLGLAFAAQSPYRTIPLGGKASFHNAALVPQARDALAAAQSERGKVPILCIDGGHLLSHDALEALRLLTNHELDTESPFATVVLGQPTLATKMKLGTLAALEQRITVRRRMTGMTSEETAEYVHHHLKLVGRADPLFTDDAVALLHQSSRGKPRSVNRLPISALIAACTGGKNLVDEASARSVVTETNHDPPPATA